jgi:hypothetical protein
VAVDRFRGGARSGRYNVAEQFDAGEKEEASHRAGSLSEIPVSFENLVPTRPRSRPAPALTRMHSTLSRTGSRLSRQAGYFTSAR